MAQPMTLGGDPHTVRAHGPTPGSTVRALGAVAWREWIIMRRYPTWFLSMAIWPVLFPLGFIFTAQALAGPGSAGLAAFESAAGTANVTGYIVIGTTVWMWINMVLWNVGGQLRVEQLRGTLESNWLAPVPRALFLLGPSLQHLAASAVFLVMSAGLFRVVFGLTWHGSMLAGALIVLAAIPSIYGIGIAFAALVLTARDLNAFVFVVRGIVMVFAGVTYPLAVLPDWMQTVARAIPLTYVIEATRRVALEGADLAAVTPSLGRLALFGAGWLAVGLALFALADRRTRRRAGLGQH